MTETGRGERGAATREAVAVAASVLSNTLPVDVVLPSRRD